MLSKKKKAFTLVESLICAVIISIVGLSSILLVSAYSRNAYARDLQTKAFTLNMNTVEYIRANVNTLEKLYDYLQNNDNVKVFAVGIGEVSLSKDALTNKINVMSIGKNEAFGFNEMLRTDKPRLFRLEVSSKVNGETSPNSKLMTMIRIGG